MVRIKIQNSSLLLFLPLFVALLSYSVFVTTDALLNGDPAGLMVIIVGLPIIFLAVGTWLWVFFGLETLSINRSSSRHKRELFGYVLTQKVVPVGELSDLRVSMPSGLASMLHNPSSQLGFGYGSIAVDQQWDTHRFGELLDENEAASLVNELKRYLPQSPC